MTMLFNHLKTTVTKPAIRFDAVRDVTALEWLPVHDVSDLPDDHGVYCFVDHNGAVRYHGAASGKTGLRLRVGNQLRFRRNHKLRVEEYRQDTSVEQAAWDVAYESPAIREAAEHDLQFWVAVAAPASWTVPDRHGEGVPTAPANALEWEAFLHGLSHITCGHRSYIGGGAWEFKRDSLMDLMTDLAWERLADMGHHWSN